MATTAKQDFVKAFSVARSMRAMAVGAAEFSAEHGRWFTSHKFEEQVRLSMGVNPAPLDSAQTRRAVFAAAHIVAVDASSAPQASIHDRLAALKESKSHDFASDYV